MLLVASNKCGALLDQRFQRLRDKILQGHRAAVLEVNGQPVLPQPPELRVEDLRVPATSALRLDHRLFRKLRFNALDPAFRP